MIDEKKLIKNLEKEWEKLVDYSEGIDVLLEYVTRFINEQPKIGEWIMCSDRLPTMEECQKNDCRFILDDGNRRYQGLFDYTEKRFIWFNCNGTQTDKCVVAWQNLPESYKTSEES